VILLDLRRAEMAEVVLAMFLMLDQDRRRFRSDRAFLFQLARRVRSLSDVNAGERFDYNTAKVRRAYFFPRLTSRDIAKIVGVAEQLVGRYVNRAKELRAFRRRQQAAVLPRKRLSPAEWALRQAQYE
jgi:hypothetical protein